MLVSHPQPTQGSAPGRRTPQCQYRLGRQRRRGAGPKRAESPHWREGERNFVPGGLTFRLPYLRHRRPFVRADRDAQAANDRSYRFCGRARGLRRRSGR